MLTYSALIITSKDKTRQVYHWDFLNYYYYYRLKYVYKNNNLYFIEANGPKSLVGHVTNYKNTSVTNITTYIKQF